jgi:hypothetical protein
MRELGLAHPSLQQRRNIMADRREFLKGAGILGFTSLSNALSAQTSSADGAPTAVSSKPTAQPEAAAIVLENAEMRLLISSNATARSLIHKPTGQECLATNTGATMFYLTQYRPYDNELQLAYPAKITQFPADHVRREGDVLIVNFALVGYEAVIGTKITDAYIAFRLEKLTFNGYTPMRPKRPHPIDETVFVQLPVRNRKNFGEWLNVMWDEAVAVNLLATNLETQIEAQPRNEYQLFQAGTVGKVKLLGAGAALIATATPHLLDRIASVEEDFDLPRGVASRRSTEYRFSYYGTGEMTPQDVDRQVKFAKMGGFRTMLIRTNAFSKSWGHLPWLPEYPRGMADLKEVTSKIRDAGIIPGLHVYHTMAGTSDAYVTPKPDPRLSLQQTYTLAKDIDAMATVIPVEENPQLCPTDGGMRVLRLQNELTRYERYTSTAPYKFEGCERGLFGTKAAPHEVSSRVGLLDMYNPDNVRFSENTSIQAEVAERLHSIYKQAGFRFTYFDGSEQLPGPYWYTVPRAQKLVWEGLEPKPLLAEGSCKAHYSWHMLTRGNAFDPAKPEEIKAAIRAYPATEVHRVAKDFTSINFGWIGYWPPSGETIGTQPDMLEYASSVAAAWDCPISLDRPESNKTILQALEAHPRTPDNLEVIRRWEDVRAQGWLTQEQKMSLRNLEQEHTLLVDENGKFVLARYFPIENVAGAKAPGRAFLFEHDGDIWVSYWHTSGQGFLELPLAVTHLTTMRELGKQVAVVGNDKQARLPLGERMYLRCHNLSRQQVILAFQNAKISST